MWFPFRFRIGLATREFGTRRTLVSSRRKQTCTPLKQPWTLPMCRHRPARQTLQQLPTQVKCTAALPSSPADSKSTLSTLLTSHTPHFTRLFSQNTSLIFTSVIFLLSSLFLSVHLFPCHTDTACLLVFALCTC